MYYVWLFIKIKIIFFALRVHKYIKFASKLEGSRKHALQNLKEFKVTIAYTNEVLIPFDDSITEIPEMVKASLTWSNLILSDIIEIF